MRDVNGRTVEADGVNDLFPSRWSPRSFNGERIDDDRFMAMIEAARWAPSSSNKQPWRIIYVHREMDTWDDVLATINEGNREWCHRASHLAVFLAKQEHDGRPDGAAEFDTGAAWMSFALQAQLSGLVTHPMGGFDKQAALEAFGVPEGYKPMAMIAVGEQGSIDDLPEHRKESERSRSSRLPLESISRAGSFPQEWN